MDEAPHSLPRWLLPTAITCLAVGLGGLAWALSRAAPSPAPDVGDAATVLPVPVSLPDFSLLDQRGTPFDSSRFEGRWSFVFFGYTFCPDVCPNTLGTLRDLRDILAADGGEQREPVQVVFISVDPLRDTTQRLAEYLPYFHPDFIGVTGAPEEVERLTRVLGIYHARADGGDEDDPDYLIDHSSAVLLVGPDAQLRAVYGHPEDPKIMATAFLKIRKLIHALEGDRA